MAKYVDGFVFLVPKKNLKAYKKMAEEGKRMWDPLESTCRHASLSIL